MHKRHKDILSSLLKENDWVKSNQLASTIQVTPRTIRNDIQAINLSYGKLVESSPKGYRLAPGSNLPQDFYTEDKYAGKKERIEYIISKLLTSEKPLDIYDLADELYISYPTIDKDLKTIESLLPQFQLALYKKSELVSIEGLEQDKRKMLSHLIYEELNNDFHDLISYREYFQDIELYKIKNILYEVMRENKVEANVYSLNAIVLHLSIAVSRIREKCLVGEALFAEADLSKYPEFRLAQNIAPKINKVFEIQMPEEEIYYLAYILIGKTNVQSPGNYDNIADTVGAYYLDISKALIRSVEKNYAINFHQEENFYRFAVHIKSLIIRAKNGMHIKNPLKDSIKSEYPLIYDIGVHIANCLKAYVQHEINEDEIAYLAIHIGASLEENKEPSGSVKTLLYCPQYTTVYQAILDNLNKNIRGDIQITGIADMLEANSIPQDIDLILSTVGINAHTLGFSGETVFINPFPKENDWKKIDNAIAKVHKIKAKKKISYFIQACTEEELFIRKQTCQNEWEAIEILCNLLEKKQYAGPQFKQHVIQREKLSSTTFGGSFAIPHSIKMDAYKTCIAILFADKPFTWGEYTVNAVFLIAISENDRQHLYAFYDDFIGLLMDEAVLEKIVKAQTYQEFYNSI